MAHALDRLATWPVPTATGAVVAGARVLATFGPTDLRLRLASISKPMAAWATMVAVEEGIIDLDDVVGPDDGSGRTLRHVLAHAGGYGFDSSGPIMAPGRKRIYSNTGYEVIAANVGAAAQMSFADYLAAAVFEPLGMTSSELRGSPAYGVWSTVDDVVRFLGEVTSPRLITPESAALTYTSQYPGLGGIVPGVGRFDTCPWGLGFEIRGDKSPHWTGSSNTAAAFGHFGGSGTMCWIDPGRRVSGEPLGVVALTDRAFDQWAADALRLWPELSDAVIEEFADQDLADTEFAGT